MLLLARGALPASPDVFEDYFNDDVKVLNHCCNILRKTTPSLSFEPEGVEERQIQP